MAKKKVKRKTIIKEVLSALAVVFFGYILLILAFLFDFLYQTVIRGIIGMFIPLGPEMRLYWFPYLMHGSFVVVICIISWLVLRSRLWTFAKAIYLTVPVAAVLVTTGMFLSHWPIISYSVGTLLCICTVYYLYRTKQPWIYYFTVIFWAIVLAIFTLLGGEI